MLQPLPAALDELPERFALKPGVAKTSPFFQYDGFLSPSTFSGAMTSSLSLADSSSTACAVSRPWSANAGICSRQRLQAGQGLHDEQHVLDRGAVGHGGVSG